MNAPCKAWALMTDNAVYLQAAFVLQYRPFKDSSLLIDVLTRDFGRLTLIAKGVRKAKSKSAAFLQPFIPLLLSYSDKTELKTLIHVETAQPYLPMQGLAVYCGFYVNELITGFLHPHDPHPEVFTIYSECLTRLQNPSDIATTLRIFELDLLEAVGYGLQLDYDNQEKNIVADHKYHFNAELGAIAATDGQFSGTTLLALKSRNFSDAKTHLEAKHLMRAVIATYLHAKPLKSRAVISKIINHL